jgi:hypothetical protein
MRNTRGSRVGSSSALPSAATFLRRSSELMDSEMTRQLTAMTVRPELTRKAMPGQTYLCGAAGSGMSGR